MIKDLYNIILKNKVPVENIAIRVERINKDIRLTDLTIPFAGKNTSAERLRRKNGTVYISLYEFITAASNSLNFIDYLKNIFPGILKKNIFMEIDHPRFGYVICIKDTPEAVSSTTMEDLCSIRKGDPRNPSEINLLLLIPSNKDDTSKIKDVLLDFGYIEDVI